MQTQLDFTKPMKHPFTGSELRDGGIAVAIENANLKHDNWAEEAYLALMTYIKIHKQPFMCEEVRDFAHIELGLPQPPHARAWGALIVRAQKEKLIIHAGYGHTTNPKAHRTPASMWIGA